MCRMLALSTTQLMENNARLYSSSKLRREVLSACS